MSASRLVGVRRRLLPLILASGILLAPGVARAGFGVQPGSFVAGSFQADGTGAIGARATPDSQAGDHPYQVTTGFKLNTTAPKELPVTRGISIPDGEIRDSVVSLPSGFAGDPNAVPYCSQATLEAVGACPNDTVVGVARLHAVPSEHSILTSFQPVYNLAPGRGELALFVFQVRPAQLTAFIHVHVRPSDYRVTATVSGIAQSQLVEATVTLWGVPADHSHDAYRGEAGSPGGGNSEPGCLEEGGFNWGAEGSSRGLCPSDVSPRPFLTNPTACVGQAPTTTLTIDSWENPGQTTPNGEPVLGDPNWLTYTAESPPLAGCDKLVFNPSLSVTPESSAVDTPTGVRVDLHVPQNEDPYGLATPELKDATVTLPAGVAISPAAANGLEGCTPAQVGIGTEAPVHCPDASKLGTVRVQSPDLPRNSDGSEGELTGSVYLGAPASGPITAPPFTIYLVAEGYGVSVRLAGTVVPDPITGQLTTTFKENPPLPFDDLQIDLFGGPRAALSTPPDCGSYATTSQLVPYSGQLAATPSSSFATSFDGKGAACPSPLPFAPAFSAGSTSTTAGAFGSFVMNISRPDGQQALSGISLSTPPGLSGVLANVQLCGESQAAQGTCPAASRIGTANAGAGPGPEPVSVSGPVFLTGPYNGAPFGLSIAVPAVAGPFDLGTVVVRSAIYVDPRDAHLVVVSDPLPQMVNTGRGATGVPVSLHRVTVHIDRAGFVFNPTSCAPMAVTGTLTSNTGASTAVSSPFQVTGCRTMPFKPSFAVSTQAKTSKANGASLDVKVTSGPGQANIGKVDVALPKALPSRLTTLQKACAEAQFAADPAGCPAGSVVGVATAVTPVLNVPLTGPAYLVSHGGAAFPDLVMVLQGQGVTIVLTGNTDIKKGITYSRFDTVPDAPVSSFELRLPQGRDSVLAANVPAAANGSFCGQSLVMPTTITGQNGAEIKQSTRISVRGCPKAKAPRKKSPRRARRARSAITTGRQH
jgi:hypothetical protein